MLPKALDDTLGFNLYRASVLMRREVLRGLAAHDLTPEQWQVLVALAAAGRPLCQAELVDSTLKDAPTISRMLRRMEQRGWVRCVRDARDARRTSVALTGRGRAAQDETLDALNSHLWRALRGMAPEEKDSLLRLLKRLRSGLGDRVDPAPTP